MYEAFEEILVRPLFLDYPEIVTDNQFLLGEDLLIIPVLQPHQQYVQGFFPAGSWKHLFSNLTIEAPVQGLSRKVPAPLGSPAVFYRVGSSLPFQGI